MKVVELATELFGRVIELGARGEKLLLDGG